MGKIKREGVERRAGALGMRLRKKGGRPEGWELDLVRLPTLEACSRHLGVIEQAIERRCRECEGCGSPGVWVDTASGELRAAVDHPLVIVPATEMLLLRSPVDGRLVCLECLAREGAEREEASSGST